MSTDFLKQTVQYFFILAIAAASLSSTGFGQENQPNEEDEPPPPPIIVLSGSEQAQLNAVTDFKRRTQLTLDLAAARLRRAEELTASENFQDALVELGGYQAVVENGLRFLERNNDDSKRIRDNFRRLEIALRSHTPRIEMLRRTTPFEYAVHLKAFMNFSRDARSRALDSFFSDTVIAGHNEKSTATTQEKNSFSTEKKP